MSRLGSLTEPPKSFARGQEVTLHILQTRLESRLTFVTCKVWEAEHIASKLGLQKTDLPSFCLAWNSGRRGSCLIMSWTCSHTLSPQIYKIRFTPHDRSVQAFRLNDKWQVLFSTDDCSFVHVNMDIHTENSHMYNLFLCFCDGSYFNLWCLFRSGVNVFSKLIQTELFLCAPF